MLFLTLYNGKNHYKTADEEEYPLPFLSLSLSLFSHYFCQVPFIPFAAHVPISATDKAIIVFFFLLPNANTPLVYLLFVIKQPFNDHEFNSCTENLKPMGD